MYNGKVVKALLAAKGLKGTQLSNYLFGDPRRSLTPLCNEGVNPGVNVLEKMAQFFEVSTDAFFTPTEELPDIAPSPEKLEQLDNVDELLRLKDEQIHLLEDRIKAIESLNDTYRREKELTAKL